MGAPNLFIDALSSADREILRPGLELRQFTRDAVVAEPGRQIEEAIFPCGCLLSVVTSISGKRVETRTIGAEGGLGPLQALGGTPSLERVLIQISGAALVTPMAALRDAARRSETITRRLAILEAGAAGQAALNVACNALHDGRRRLCRWLLGTADRVGSDVLPLTQEHLATMLGVQRTTVTALAGELQEAGLLRYSRGRLMIRDRRGLEAVSCECYELDRRRLSTLFGAPAAAGEARLPAR